MLYDGLEYCEWQESEDLKSDAVSRYFGTRDSLTGAKHGIIRVIEKDGKIYERSYKNNTQHGLEIKYKN
jgi:hypothetical protein